MEATEVFIALGSNLGDREPTLRKALELMNAIAGIQVVAVSDFIETEPGGATDQGMFINGAAQIRTTLSPEELLEALHKVEHELGRDRTRQQRWGPRTCDLDILMVGDLVLDSPKIKIPHPYMHERLFVLEPLAQIAPNAVHPVLKKTIRQLLQEARNK